MASQIGVRHVLCSNRDGQRVSGRHLDSPASRNPETPSAEPCLGTSMIYAFVDTNIFVRIATQGRPGCEQAHFDNLRVLVQEGMFRLLVPEVVTLEVEKLFKGLPRSIESACDKLNDSVSKATQDTWNEI